MIKITLTNADNGIIKRVKYKSNYDNVSDSRKETKLYELDSDEDIFYNYEKIVDFVEDIFDDLSIDVGNDFNESRLKLVCDWGDKYIPSLDEIDEKIKDLKFELKELQNLKKQIKDSESVV